MAQGQEYSKDQMVALAIGFMILPTVFYGLRVWARMLINRVTLDDYLAGAALVSATDFAQLQLVALTPMVTDFYHCLLFTSVIWYVDLQHSYTNS
jgi:hypothetical protein